MSSADKARPGDTSSRPLYFKLVADQRADLVAAAVTVVVVYVASLAERGGSSAVRIPVKAELLYWLERAAWQLEERAWRRAKYWHHVRRLAKLRYDLETY